MAIKKENWPQKKRQKKVRNWPKFRKSTSAEPSTSSSSANQESILVDETPQVYCEKELAPQYESRDLGESLALSESRDQHESDEGGRKDECSDNMDISNDSGLWNVQADVISLQKYWVAKGKCRVSG